MNRKCSKKDVQEEGVHYFCKSLKKIPAFVTRLNEIFDENETSGAFGHYSTL